jgi:hypothetical protein
VVRTAVLSLVTAVVLVTLAVAAALPQTERELARVFTGNPVQPCPDRTAVAAQLGVLPGPGDYDRQPEVIDLVYDTADWLREQGWRVPQDANPTFDRVDGRLVPVFRAPGHEVTRLQAVLDAQFGAGTFAVTRELWPADAVYDAGEAILRHYAAIYRLAEISSTSAPHIGPYELGLVRVNREVLDLLAAVAGPDMVCVVVSGPFRFDTATR